jgi:lysine 2,3-aminomutase
VFLPQRITPELCEIFKKYGPVWMSIHVNHPQEATAELKARASASAFAGVPLGNQSVLLKGVNDDAEVMKALVHRLLRMRVRPYYLYQMDLITGRLPLQGGCPQGDRDHPGVARAHDRLRGAPSM